MALRQIVQIGEPVLRKKIKKRLKKLMKDNTIIR